MTSAASIGNTSIAYDASSEDVDKILSEAGAVAEQRVNENFPDVPMDHMAVDQAQGLR